MGVRRILISPALVSIALRNGLRVSEALEPVQDAEVLDVRLTAHPPAIELLIQAAQFDGPSFEALASQHFYDGHWDEIPIFLPTFRSLEQKLVVVPPGAYTPAELEERAGQSQPIADPDDRHGEIEGA